MLENLAGMNKGFICLLSIVLLGFVRCSDASRDMDSFQSLDIVLHSNFGGKSHIKGALELGEILYERGHKITYASFDDNLSHANGYNATKDSIGPPVYSDLELTEIVLRNIGDPSNPPDILTATTETIKETMFRGYTETAKSLGSYLDIKKPDLMICDFSTVACMDLAKLKGIPLVIYMQSIDGFRISEASYFARSYKFGPLTIENMSFIERLKAVFINPFLDDNKIKPILKARNEMRQKLGLPRTNNLVSGIDYGLSIANSFTGLEAALHRPPNIIPVGPILSKELSKVDNTLDSVLEAFFDSHERIVYIAFGSMVILNSEDISRLLNSVVINLENNVIDGVIWGLGRTLLSDFPDTFTLNNSLVNISSMANDLHPHIKILKWAPQKAILDHPNTKLFISHGGMESSSEAMYFGTPVICIPYVGDQPRNAAKLVAAGMGTYINRNKDTVSTTATTIENMIKDPSGFFKGNATRLQFVAKYSSRRKELAANLIEQHALMAKECRKTQIYDFNTNLPPCELAHLIPAGNRMSWVFRNSVDIYIALFLAFAFGSYLVSIPIIYLMKLSKQAQSLRKKYQ